jgi:hypothetical protein
LSKKKEKKSQKKKSFFGRESDFEEYQKGEGFREKGRRKRGKEKEKREEEGVPVLRIPRGMWRWVRIVRPIPRTGERGGSGRGKGEGRGRPC